jgi:alpha-ribazole phosphatase
MLERLTTAMTPPAATRPSADRSVDPLASADGALWIWRHPRAQQAQGRCIGRSDLPVSARRAKRLAHHIRQAARRAGLPHCVLTSPLARCHAVGRQLQRWGWLHRVDPALQEMDFGAWDGQPWADIPQAAVDAWCADFLHHRPGGGDSLQALFSRVAAWQPPTVPTLVVGHGGWMLARQWLASGRPWPHQAADWPAPPAHGQCWRLPAALPAQQDPVVPT